MMRNDYRRALILLRGNAPGYSGHVRLERRTLMGSMYFQVQAPGDRPLLKAALVGRGRDNYYACELGEITLDNRGQGVLSYSFDPRNVCGHVLEDYQLIVVSGSGTEGCEILLCGNVCGHADLNWERVRTAVCGLYSDGIARSATQEGDAPVSDREIAQEIRREIQEEAEDLGEEIEEAQAEGRDAASEVREEILEEFEEIPGLLSDRRESAAELLDLDIDLPWPGDVEALRTLFMYSPPLANPPDALYIYIAAPMPEESGYPYVAVGIRAEGGVPAAVRYALPSRWSAEPPEGLEEYTWVGNGNRGWWVTEMEIHPDGAI